MQLRHTFIIPVTRSVTHRKKSATHAETKTNLIGSTFKQSIVLDFFCVLKLTVTVFIALDVGAQ